MSKHKDGHFSYGSVRAPVGMLCVLFGDGVSADFKEVRCPFLQRYFKPSWLVSKLSL